MKAKPAESKQSADHKKSSLPAHEQLAPRAGRPVPRLTASPRKFDSMDTGNGVEPRLDGSHSEPLKDDAMRLAALAEQTKLQANPDSLPVAGYPTKRHLASASRNPADPQLPVPVKSKV